MANVTSFKNCPRVLTIIVSATLVALIFVKMPTISKMKTYHMYQSSAKSSGEHESAKSSGEHESAKSSGEYESIVKCVHMTDINFLSTSNEKTAICSDGHFAIAPPCKIYIFGIPPVQRITNLEESKCNIYIFDEKISSSNWKRKNIVVTKKGIAGVNKDNKRSMTFGDLRDALSHTEEVIDLVMFGPRASNRDVLKTIFIMDSLVGVKQVALIVPVISRHVTDDVITSGMKAARFSPTTQSSAPCPGYKGGCTTHVYINNKFTTSDPDPFGVDLGTLTFPDLGHMTHHQLENYFHSFVKKKHLACEKVVRFGNNADGGWSVCMDEPYALGSSSCLVYSFGIRNEWSFDDGISKKYGCNVRSFDPSMNVKTHDRSNKIKFFALGLAGFDGQDTVRNWPMKKLSTFIKDIGDAGKVIDYLKIDIDYSEWDSFPAFLADGILKNVKQLAIEIHTYEMFKHRRLIPQFDSTPEQLRMYLGILKEIENQGFRRWLIHSNGWGIFDSAATRIRRTCCFELYYVNTRFLQKNKTG